MSDKTRADYHQQVLDSTPGRFEGEPDWTPYFYDAAMDGDGEEFYAECGHRNNCACESELLYVEFEIEAEDIALFPELEGKHVRLYISEQGFISTTIEVS